MSLIEEIYNNDNNNDNNNNNNNNSNNNMRSIKVHPLQL